jgi:hypothetical protein
VGKPYEKKTVYNYRRPVTEKNCFHGYSAGKVLFAKKVVPFHKKYETYKKLDEIFELLDLPKETQQELHKIKDIRKLTKELANQLAYQQSISSQNGNLY